MLPRGLKTSPKLTQKSTQNCPLAHPGAPRWNQNPILSFWDRFWSPIWCPLGPKIDQKSIPCEKNCQKSALSKQCLTGAVHHLIFYTFWGSFLVKKQWKKTSRCCASCWHFPPLKNHVFYRLPCLGTVFLQICWNTKNLTKKQKKNMKNRSVDYITKIVTKSLL